jgi:hypothetical protein
MVVALQSPVDDPLEGPATLGVAQLVELVLADWKRAKIKLCTLCGKR